MVSHEDNQRLLRPILLSKVRDAMFSLDPDSANKILIRVVCDRLSGLLPSFISDKQSTFLKRHDIADNILLG